MMTVQFEQTGKKAYPVLAVKPEEALDAARQYLTETELNIDVVFFDLPGTVSSKGILKAMLNMDFIFCPVTTDRLVMQSSLTFASMIRDCMAQHPDAPLKGFSLFWNQLVKTENKEVYGAYCSIIERLKLNVLKTEIPHTIKYKREMSGVNKQIFRSTLFPPTKSLVKGTCLDSLMEEICQIIHLM
jgi:cellulose biosynthesis protein BcsQ